jgi:dTDP-4-amino-4,6-dideoxygalactose transaminase
VVNALAIDGGSPIRTEAYPAWPVWDQRDLDAVAAVIRSGRWGGFPYPGPETAELLRGFLAWQGGHDAVAVMNGSITMEVALRAAEIGWGDEVIVPGYTFLATASAAITAGATPVLVDVLDSTYCVDPAAVRAALTPRTRAIAVVHLGSHMADMDAIMAIAAERDLIVIEDCAHAHGSRWRDAGAGTIGHFGSFSLQSSKTMTTGEGGILVCRTTDLADRARVVMDCGRDHGEATPLRTLGSNYRMTELQAALGRIACERAPAQQAEREAMATRLDARLAEIPGVRVLPRDPRQTRRGVFQYGVALDPDAIAKGLAQRALEAEGIPAWGGYWPLALCPEYQPLGSRLPVPRAEPEAFRVDPARMPASLRALERSLWLPEQVFRAGERGVDDVVGAFHKLAARVRRG